MYYNRRKQQFTVILLPQYLERFILKGPRGYGTYCSERLSRIKANGERKEPPCWIELQVEMLVSCLPGSIPVLSNTSELAISFHSTPLIFSKSIFSPADRLQNQRSPYVCL